MKCIGLLILVLLSNEVAGQHTGSFLPKRINSKDRFLFYQHGSVVTMKGNNAINDAVPEWGPYEYLNILDTLKKRGFNVISENRKQGVDNSVYVNKTVMQIDTLLKQGVKAKNIIVVGASAGWEITLSVSAKIANDKIKYVIMGGCWPETYKDFIDYDLHGIILSIYEKTDPHQSCIKILENKKAVRGSKEIMISTGLSHGFIYKGFKEWVDPVVKWSKE